MQSVEFLKSIDNQSNPEDITKECHNIPAEVISMACHYLAKELVPIPVESISQKKLAKAAKGSVEKGRELLVLFLGTCLLGYQVTGQFAGLSFGANEQELYSASLVIQTFYDLDNPVGPEELSGRIFYRPKASLWQKVYAVAEARGLIKDC